jgi:hypothetical protein
MIENRPPRQTIRFGRFTIRVPGTRLQRTILGGLLCIGGVLGFLPILGFWMLPLGILILSVEFHVVRRMRRRLEIWWGRKRQKRQQKRAAAARKKAP